MSTRRSGRSKAPVKYTSDSGGSDFGDKKRKKSASKATPKKRTKTDADAAEAAEPAKKDTKAKPEALAASHSEKGAAQDAKAQKAVHKKAWEDWLEAHDLSGALLDTEPAKDVSITQTDALKKYGLKKEELGSLKHFEKKNPLYNNTIKLYLEKEVRSLVFRKTGTLEGGEEGEDDKDLLGRGEDIWKNENPHDFNDQKQKQKADKKKADKVAKPKTPKQQWAAYLESHGVADDAGLAEEPEDPVNQSESKTKYGLTPGDLVVLPYFPKPNPKYGNTTKVFKDGEVKTLAYRKAAVLGGVEEDDEVELLEQGKELFDEHKEKK